MRQIREKAAWPSIWPTMCRSRLEYDVPSHPIAKAANSAFGNYRPSAVHSIVPPTIEAANLENRRAMEKTGCAMEVRSEQQSATGGPAPLAN